MSEPTPEELEHLRTLQTDLRERSTGVHVRTMLKLVLETLGVTASPDGQVRGVLAVQARLSGRVDDLEAGFTRISRGYSVVLFAAVAVTVAAVAVTAQVVDGFYTKYAEAAPAVDVHARGER